MKFYPYKKGGGVEKVLALLKGRDTKSFEVVLKQELEVLAILMGGGGGWRGAQCFGPTIFSFCSPLASPVINCQSLTYANYKSVKAIYKIRVLFMNVIFNIEPSEISKEKPFLLFLFFTILEWHFCTRQIYLINLYQSCKTHISSRTTTTAV